MNAIILFAVIIFFVIGLLIGIFGVSKKCNACPSYPECASGGTCPTCPTASPCPTAEGCPTASPCPTATGCPTASPCPTATGCPTASPCPTATGCPTASPCPAVASGSGTVSLVAVSSVQDQDNTTVNGTGVLANVNDNQSNTFWNPTRGGPTNYRLLFRFDRTTPIKLILVNLTGDTVHDPTSINVYTDTNQNTLLASVGDVMKGKTVIPIEIRNPVSTNQLYIDIGKTTQYQLYLNGIYFYA